MVSGPATNGGKGPLVKTVTVSNAPRERALPPHVRDPGQTPRPSFHPICDETH